MADQLTPEQIAALKEQLRQLNEQYERLAGKKFFEDMPDDIKLINNLVGILNKEIYDLEHKFDSISKTLQNVLTDFNGAGRIITSINGSFSKLVSLASKVQEHASGINILSVKELRNIQNRASAEVKNLAFQRDQAEKELNSTKLTTAQREKLNFQVTELNKALAEETSYLKTINGLIDEEITNEKLLNKNLGLTGSLLKGISKTLQRFGVDSEVIDNMGKKLRKAADPNQNGGAVGFKTLFKIIGEGFKEALEDPMARFVIGLKLAQSGFNDLKKAFNIFLEFDKTIVSAARNLGLQKEQVQGIVKQAKAADTAIKGINDTFNTVYTNEQLSKALADVNNQLGLSVDIGAKSLNEFTAMTNQMGLSAEEATNLYKIGVLNNMSLEDTNKTIASNIIATRKQTGVQVNARQVLQEIAKLSAGITTKFQQNPDALAKAVTQAKALGTNLEQVDKVGESLLNFETSIENELKAELLTGRQINVEKARYAALTGDQATLTAELADQVGSLADFQEMNVLAQKSLAEAFGLSRDEVADMLTKQETFNKLGDVSKKSAQEQLQIARERGLSETDSLMVNLKQQAAAEKTAAAFDNFKMAVADIITGIQPLVDIFASLSKHAWLVYTAMGLIAGVSLAKTVGGIALMISSLVAANIQALTLQTVLTTGGILIALPLLLGAAYGVYKSLSSAATPQQTQDGIAPASKGPFTITDSYGATAVTTVGDGVVVSPNINRNSINRPTQPSFNTSAITDAIATLSNTVSGLVNRAQPTPQFALHVDGRMIGTAVGRQMETGTSQLMNTSYELA
jgi:antitoxin component HigA of HigAB toxin-antitoxin module